MAKRASMDGSGGMSPRKAMAMGDSSGGFGVEPFHSAQGSTPHPDVAAGTGMKAPLGDHERGAPPAVFHTKGMHPAQAAPDHGHTHPGGYGSSHTYGGKV